MNLLAPLDIKRYWVSWYSNYCVKCGHTKPPFQVWISGYSADDRRFCKHGIDKAIICAVLDASDEIILWNAVKKHFSDCEKRLCKEVSLDFVPGNRFPDFENRTALEQTEELTVTCPKCQGKKKVFAHINRGRKPHTWEDIDCFYCKGSGLIPSEQLGWIEEGEQLRQYIINGKKSMRELAGQCYMRISEMSNCISGTAKMPDCLRALIQTTEKE